MESEQVAAVQEASDDSKPTVLVVDDSRTNLQRVGAIVRGHYHVLTANSGQRAIELASQAPQPDLILLDIIMPDMDGYEVMRQLRQNPSTTGIPVIFVTARNALEDEQLGLELGAVDYMTKPLRPAILLARLHNHLELKAARDRLKNENLSLESRIFERSKTLQAILDSSDHLIVMILPDGRVMEMNRAGANRLGSTPANLAGRNFFELVPAGIANDLRLRVMDVVKHGQALELDQTRDGRTLHTTVFPVAGSPKRVVIYAVDITTYVQAEAALRREHEELAAALTHQRMLNRKLEEAQNQLLQSEKMASLGQLAAGVAHELNNPIGFVHSNLGTLETYVNDVLEIADAYGEAARRAGNAVDFTVANALKRDKDLDFIRQDIVSLMSESKDGLQRVRQIVQNLKNFSHVGDNNWAWADIHAGLDSTLTIVWNELKYKCKVIKNYASDLPQIYCLPSQLNQVFMNLLVNAGHAIADKGEIVISTERAGESIRILISDTGEGIPEENLQRIFEPFFTTKPVGKGTGLGLSIAYGIIAKHQGKIDVDSVVGRGTSFLITLPIEAPLLNDVPGR
jgi:PAS domain S-box-containing protein